MQNSEILKEYMKKHGLSMADIANKSDVGEKTIKRILINEGRTRGAVIDAINEAFPDLCLNRIGTFASNEQIDEEYYKEERASLDKATWLSPIEKRVLSDLLDASRSDAVSYVFSCLTGTIDDKQGKKDCYYSMLNEIACVVQHSTISTYQSEVEAAIMGLIITMKAIQQDRPSEDCASVLSALNSAQLSGDESERYNAIKRVFYYSFEHWNSLSVKDKRYIMSLISISLDNAPDSKEDRKRFFYAVFNAYSLCR